MDGVAFSGGSLAPLLGRVSCTERRAVQLHTHRPFGPRARILVVVVGRPRPSREQRELCNAAALGLIRHGVGTVEVNAPLRGGVVVEARSSHTPPLRLSVADESPRWFIFVCSMP